MISFRLLNRQKLGYIITAAAILLGAFVPALANAADVTERSIALSSSSADASAVSYTINFKATTGAGAFVLDFCSNSPISTEACTPAAGLIVKSATASTSGYTANATTANVNNQVEVTATTPFVAADSVSVELTGIHNPTASGTYYARITTYDTEAHALAYTSTVLGTGAKDTGSFAIAINNTVGVSGAVLESMTFCVSGTDITGAGCSAGVTAPTLKLGNDPGTGVVSLNDGTISSGTIYTQLTTNATGGAVVNLKSSAAGCGGLINSSKPDGCYIVPALNNDIVLHTAAFGVKLGTSSVGGTGTLVPVTGSHYNASTYALNYTAGDGSGVTSTYGDPFLTTNGGQVDSKNQDLVFGATVGASTPAGNYSADIGLIATGKF